MIMLFKFFVFFLITMRAEASSVVLVQPGLENVGLKIENRLVEQENRFFLSRVNFTGVSSGEYEVVGEQSLYSENGLSASQWQSLLIKFESIRNEQQKLLSVTGCASILLSSAVVIGAYVFKANVELPMLTLITVISAIVPQIAHVILTPNHFAVAQLGQGLQFASLSKPSVYSSLLVPSHDRYVGLGSETTVYKLNRSEKILSGETLGFAQHRGSIESAIVDILK